MYNYRRLVNEKNVASAITNRVAQIARKAGVLRPRDLTPYKIPRQYISLAEREGKITRVGRGLYVVAGAKVTENHSIAQACKRVPHGVICLLSALRFHDLTTQAPFEVWMAIGIKSRTPKPGNPQLRIVRFSEKMLRLGVQQKLIEGVPVKITSPARTVVDCFRYRNKIGQDVALEALRDCYRQRKATLDEIWDAAQACRVANIMKPYVESLA